MILRHFPFRPARMAFAVAISLAAGVVPTIAAGATVPTQEVGARAKSACDLLTSAEITSVFTDAPLDPGPKKVRGSKQAKNFSFCAWDDKRTGRRTVPELVAYTNLARALTTTQEELLTIRSTDLTARALTPSELEGLGTKGVMEIQPDGASGSIGVLKGNNYSIVTISYVGAPPKAPILDAQLLALARIAAPRV